jgi:hypothetical protein
MCFSVVALQWRSFCKQILVASLTIAILLVTQAHGQADVNPKRVLMLHSFGPRFKPWSDYAQAIRAEINGSSRNSVEFLEHSLVDTRQSQEKSDDAFVAANAALGN